MSAWAELAWATNAWAQNSWEGIGEPIVISAGTTGTAVNVPEATIVSTGGTVIITLVNDTFIAAGTGPIGTTAQSTAFAQALSAAVTRTNGWNTAVRDLLDSTNLVRTSDTVATFTIPATAGYAPSASETITPVIQAAILTTSALDINATAFGITVVSGADSFIDDLTEDPTEAVITDPIFA